MKGPTSSQGVKARRRAAQAAGKLTAAELGARLNASPPLIRKVIAGKIAGKKIAADQDGMIDPSEEARIRAEYPCHEPGCPRVGLGPSGYCHDHKANGQRGAKRTPEQRARIGEGMRGKPRPWMSDVMRERWADPEQRKALLKARQKKIDRAKTEVVKRKARESDSLTVKDVVRHLRNAHVYRSAATVAQHIRDDLLEADRIPAPGYAGRGVYLIPCTAADEYADLLRSYPDGRMTRFNFESAQARSDWYEEHWPHKAHEEKGRLVRELHPDKPVGPERLVTADQIDEIYQRADGVWPGQNPKRRSIRAIAEDIGLPWGRVRRVLDARRIAVP